MTDDIRNGLNDGETVFDLEDSAADQPENLPDALQDGTFDPAPADAAEADESEPQELEDLLPELTEENVTPKEPLPQDKAKKTDKPYFDIDLTDAEVMIPDYIRTAQPVYDFEFYNKKKKRRPNKRGGGMLVTLIYLVVVAALAIIVSQFALSVVKDVTGIEKENVDITIEVPEGATLAQIADILQKNKLIDSSFGLLAYAKLTKADYTYQPGTFTLNPMMGYSEILKKLTEQNIIREEVTVRIIEGKTIDEIAQTLEDAQVCTAEEFIDALENKDFDSYAFVADIPENEDRIYKLEGYLFPDTYKFFKNSDPDDVIKKFLDNFNVRFSEELRAEAKEKGMTVEEVVVLASIVQKEGKSKKTMEMVAGVFLNRLNNSKKYPYLQSNATLGYSLGEAIFWMSEEDMQNPDPYNTYTHEGLPPSAICNPGLQAIKAVISPDDNDYYFFVNDENGLFFFSKTASEHEKQVEAIKKNGTGNGEGIS